MWVLSHRVYLTLRCLIIRWRIDFSWWDFISLDFSPFSFFKFLFESFIVPRSSHIPNSREIYDIIGVNSNGEIFCWILLFLLISRFVLGILWYLKGETIARWDDNFLVGSTGWFLIRDLMINSRNGFVWEIMVANELFMRMFDVSVGYWVRVFAEL